jgi:MFS family permease
LLGLDRKPTLARHLCGGAALFYHYFHIGEIYLLPHPLQLDCWEQPMLWLSWWQVGRLLLRFEHKFAYAAANAAPVIGMLSDSYGRRPMLLLCLGMRNAIETRDESCAPPVAGTFVSFLMMAMSIENYYVVLASRILDGILGGNISLAQAYVSGLNAMQVSSARDSCSQICRRRELRDRNDLDL